MPPSNPGQPPQWEQHRYPPQGQPYGAQQVSGFLIVYNLLYTCICKHSFTLFLESLGSNGASANENAKTWISSGWK